MLIFVLREPKQRALKKLRQLRFVAENCRRSTIGGKLLVDKRKFVFAAVLQELGSNAGGTPIFISTRYLPLVLKILCKWHLHRHFLTFQERSFGKDVVAFSRLCTQTQNPHLATAMNGCSVTVLGSLILYVCDCLILLIAL